MKSILTKNTGVLKKKKNEIATVRLVTETYWCLSRTGKDQGLWDPTAVADQNILHIFLKRDRQTVMYRPFKTKG